MPAKPRASSMIRAACFCTGARDIEYCKGVIDMATFLFLVSVSATTLLFIAIASEEIARVVRGFFARKEALREPAAPVTSHECPQLSVLRGTSSPHRSVQAETDDWDRAA
jgi:hypothetical protein